MAFPPSFDRPWDETFPPDTQAANLLGQDLRNGKTDIRERLSLISGTFANRPTPEASWGGAGFGMIYISTDTKQIFQWNGAAWVDVSPSVGSGTVDYDNFTRTVLAGAACPVQGHSVVIPAGAIQNANAVGSYIEVESGFTLSSSTGATPDYQFIINGVGVSFIALPNGNAYVIRMKIILSNTILPRIVVDAYNNANNISTQVFTGAFGTLDGSVPVTISDSFFNATTVTANVEYLHVRVRK